MVHKLLGQMLIERKLISAADLQNGLALQRERKDKIGRILVDLGSLAERDLIATLSEQHQAPLLTAEEYPAVSVEIDKLSGKFLKQFKVLPLDLEGNLLTVVMADPSDSDTLESLRLFTGHRIKVRLGLESDITEALERLYGDSSGGVAHVEGDEAGAGGSTDPGEDIEHLRDLASEVPVIRMVNLMISRAVERRASDIHIEPFEKEFRVRYRVDGILHNVESPPIQLKAAIISRVKLMAKLNIAERRLPQDGRIKIEGSGQGDRPAGFDTPDTLW